MCAQNVCPGPIGNSNESRGTERREQMFYLNTANPAPCTGNITSWRVCYYGPENNGLLNGLRSYWATYAVYRMVGSGRDGRYERVSEIFRAVRATRLLINRDISSDIDGVIQGGFNCYEDSIDIGESPLTVQAGDVVGACVFDPVDQPRMNRRQLGVVGNVNGVSLLAMTAGGCALDSIPSNISVNDLSMVKSTTLHLYANVGMLKFMIIILL